MGMSVLAVLPCRTARKRGRWSCIGGSRQPDVAPCRVASALGYRHEQGTKPGAGPEYVPHCRERRAPTAKQERGIEETAHLPDIPDTMAAVLLTGHGGPDRLEYRTDVPVPRPAAGEVLVEVAACGLNNTDIWVREGAYGTADDPGAVATWRGDGRTGAARPSPGD